MKSNVSQIGYQQAFNTSNKWLVRMLTLIIWMFALLCAVYWGLKFTKLSQISATPAAIVPAKAVETQAIAQLLGSIGAIESKHISAAVNKSLVLHGIANTNSGGGVALIAVDGKPAKPHGVGSQVTETWKLKSLSRTGVVLVNSKSSAEEMSLTLQARQSTTGIIVNTNSTNVGSNTPRIPLPMRNNAIDTNNLTPGASNPSASNTAAVASASGLIASPSVRAVSKYANQDANTTPVGSMSQVEQIIAPSSSNRAPSSTSADTTPLK